MKEKNCIITFHGLRRVYMRIFILAADPRETNRRKKIPKMTFKVGLNFWCFSYSCHVPLSTSSQTIRFDTRNFGGWWVRQKKKTAQYNHTRSFFLTATMDFDRSLVLRVPHINWSIHYVYSFTEQKFAFNQPFGNGVDASITVLRISHRWLGS